MTTEADRGRAELEELREAVLRDWIVVTTRSAGALEAMQATFSWRVTRPLRLVQQFRRASREQGLRPALDLAAVAVARRLGRG